MKALSHGKAAPPSVAIKSLNLLFLVILATPKGKGLYNFNTSYLFD